MRQDIWGWKKNLNQKPIGHEICQKYVDSLIMFETLKYWKYHALVLWFSLIDKYEKETEITWNCHEKNIKSFSSHLHFCLQFT